MDINEKRKLNYNLCKESAEFGSGISKGKPILLTIEPANFCNLKCPICFTGSGIGKREKKLLSFENYKYILDQFDDCLSRMFFYYLGEPFLNKDSYKMIRYAADRDIDITSCTNGSHVNPKEILDSGLHEIDFQIAGITEDVHALYRVNSSLKDVLKNLEELIALRNSTKSDIKIVLGYILMKHNEHQLDDFKRYAEGVGVDKINIIGTTALNVEQAKKYLPSDRKYWMFEEEALNQNKLKPKRARQNYCGWIYSTATVMVNGDVVPCCYDGTAKYVVGNVFEEDFSSIWNNEKFQAVRKRVSTDSANYDLCYRCYGEGLPRISL